MEDGQRNAYVGGDIVELRGSYLTPDCGGFITWGSALRAMCIKEQRKVEWATASVELI